MGKETLTREQVLAGVKDAALHPATRAALIKRLPSLERRESLPALAALLRDPEQVIRVKALQAIRQVGGPDAVDVLIDALRHEDQRTAFWAVLRLGQLNYQFSGPAILAVAEERWSSLNDETRRSFLMTLTRFRLQEAVPLLKVAVMSSDSGVRLRAAAALRGIGSVESREVLDWAISELSPSDARAVRRGARPRGPLRWLRKRIVNRILDRL